MASAYLLVAHGSQDAHYQPALLSLAQQVSDCFQAMGHSTWVGTACLELVPTSLHQQICQFCLTALEKGFSQVDVLPLFLLPGVHVKEDIPAQLDLATQYLLTETVDQLSKGAIASRPSFRLLPHLGECPHLAELFTNSATAHRQLFPATGRIVISHGSRRPGGNQPVEALAKQLGAIAAYWSVPPSLENQVQNWIQRDCRQITVLPYLLFSGGLTNAIAQQIERFHQQFAGVEIQLAAPIVDHPQLPTLLVDWLLAVNDRA